MRNEDVAEALDFLDKLSPGEIRAELEALRRRYRLLKYLLAQARSLEEDGRCRCEPDPCAPPY